MSALAEVAAAGGRVWAEGDKLKYRLPKDRADLLAELRERKAEILAELRGKDAALLARCKTACKGLSLWPEELMAHLDDGDKTAILSGDPAELGALRCMAEGLSERLRTGTLPPHLHGAYKRLEQQLAEHPSQRFACEVLTPDADPVLVAVCVRGAGFATLRITRERYDEGKLLEMVHRWNTRGDLL